MPAWPFSESIDQVEASQAEMRSLVASISQASFLPNEYPLENAALTRSYPASSRLVCDHPEVSSLRDSVPTTQRPSMYSYPICNPPSDFGGPTASFLEPFAGPTSPDLFTDPMYSSSIVGSPGPSDPQSYFTSPLNTFQYTSPLGEPPCFSPGGVDRQQSWPGAQEVTERGHHFLPSAPSSNVDARSFLVCCGHQFASKSSLDRHRKNSCKRTPSEPNRFQCQVHCQKTYSRRCNLRKHLKGVGYSDVVVDGVVRQMYGKGMHRRSY